MASKVSTGLDLIQANWPAPQNVRAYISTRTGGVSVGGAVGECGDSNDQHGFASLNLGDHVGDDPKSVAQNRSLFAQACAIAPERIAWLKQVHGVEVAVVDELEHAGNCAEVGQGALAVHEAVCADAATTLKAGVACVIMTADCLPVLLCDAKGTRVAAVHAGWRGLANGVIEEALRCFDGDASVMAYLGPAISQKHFEVGLEVKQQFEAVNSEFADAFKPAGGESVEPKYYCDMYAIARSILNQCGVKQVFGGQFCTFAQDELFFSYRRDGKVSGRMASLIYLDS